MSTVMDQSPGIPLATNASQPRKPLIRPIPRKLSFLLTVSIGILLSASPWTAILVVGWTFRLMRRRIFFGWWNERNSDEHVPLDAQSVRFDDQFPVATLPRWVVSERVIESLGRRTPDDSPPTRLRRIARLPRELTGALRSNLRWGIMAFLCTLILTYPACVLWLGSWYDGWNNSFTKGYENAFVGLQAGLFAHLLFVLAMLYVPMAWGHLAASGQIRSVFQFGILARLIWSSGWSVSVYALIFSMATLPVLALRSAPFAFVLGDPDAWADAEPEEVLRVLSQYQLAAGIYLFPAFVLLHLLIARIYRSALRKSLKQNPRLIHRLPHSIRATLFEYRLIPEDPPRRGPALRMVRWSARSTSSLFALLTASILWFIVIGQIYVGQFLNYLPWAGWLNQPLIHLPCLQVIPRSLG